MNMNLFRFSGVATIVVRHTMPKKFHMLLPGKNFLPKFKKIGKIELS